MHSYGYFVVFATLLFGFRFIKDKIRFTLSDISFACFGTAFSFAEKLMPKNTKTFGVNKNSKRKQNRKKRESTIIPLSIIPRSDAPAVFQLIENNRNRGELLLSNDLKQFML
ncbi:MAG: hypothetical protein ACI8P9_001943 [Parasphingorhabdus sp.]|jgi:hypothetical protein